jgi:hypothetical protein
VCLGRLGIGFDKLFHDAIGQLGLILASTQRGREIRIQLDIGRCDRFLGVELIGLGIVTDQLVRKTDGFIEIPSAGKVCCPHCLQFGIGRVALKQHIKVFEGIGVTINTGAAEQFDESPAQLLGFGLSGDGIDAKRVLDRVDRRGEIGERDVVRLRSVGVRHGQLQAHVVVLGLNRQILLIRAGGLFEVVLLLRLFGLAQKPIGLSSDLEPPQTVHCTGTNQRSDD